MEHSSASSALRPTWLALACTSTISRRFSQNCGILTSSMWRKSLATKYSTITCRPLAWWICLKSAKSTPNLRLKSTRRKSCRLSWARLLSHQAVVMALKRRPKLATNRIRMDRLLLLPTRRTTRTRQPKKSTRRWTSSTRKSISGTKKSIASSTSSLNEK